jgi:UDP-N-acetylmuramoylalanine--D-glutamate ligase
VVLMSPACASYDMFDNFQQRGQIFRDLVKALK